MLVPGAGASNSLSVIFLSTLLARAACPQRGGGPLRTWTVLTRRCCPWLNHMHMTVQSPSTSSRTRRATRSSSSPTTSRSSAAAAGAAERRAPCAAAAVIVVEWRIMSCDARGDKEVLLPFAFASRRSTGPVRGRDSCLGCRALRVVALACFWTRGVWAVCAHREPRPDLAQYANLAAVVCARLPAIAVCCGGLACAQRWRQRARVLGCRGLEGQHAPPCGHAGGVERVCGHGGEALGRAAPEHLAGPLRRASDSSPGTTSSPHVCVVSLCHEAPRCVLRAVCAVCCGGGGGVVPFFRFPVAACEPVVGWRGERCTMAWEGASRRGAAMHNCG